MTLTDNDKKRVHQPVLYHLVKATDLPREARGPRLEEYAEACTNMIADLVGTEADDDS